MQKVFRLQKRDVFQYTVLIFLLLSTVLIAINLFLQYKINDVQKKELLSGEQTLMDIENVVVSNKIDKISGDLLYLTDCFRLHDEEDGGDEMIAKEWLAFSNRKKIYDQIRYIDADGQETIRVNAGVNGAVLVEQEQLQNKKDRYYVQETMNLRNNQIYISPLDLNMEQGVIELPVKPTLRISMPYYDANNQLKGMIILNYLADDMLKQVEKVASSSNGEIFLLNADGYWLYDSADEDKAFAFMYADKAEQSFANQYPLEWEKIQKDTNGYAIDETGAFLYSNITPCTVSDAMECSIVFPAGNWTLVSYMPHDSSNGLLFTQSIGEMLLKLIKDNYLLHLFVLVLSFTISVLYVIDKQRRREIQYFSEYDVMTGVYNRRAGFDKLNQLYAAIPRKTCAFTICFIDINGLKEVNDVLGHDAGDELIVSAVKVIRQNIRKMDFIARLGGDEFLIVFQNLTEQETEAIWEKIIQEYTRINETENRPYLISVSHGVEAFQCHSHAYIDEMINHADEKMYHEKRKIKERFTVLRTSEMEE